MTYNVFGGTLNLLCYYYYSPFVPKLCILSGQVKTFHMLHDAITLTDAIDRPTDHLSVREFDFCQKNECQEINHKSGENFVRVNSLLLT